MPFTPCRIGLGFLLLLACTTPKDADRPADPSVPFTTSALTIGAVTIVDSVLRIPLKNGEVLELVSNPHTEGSTVQYTYGGHQGRVPFHGVAVRYYEAIAYQLYHDSTGRLTRLDAAPVVSPSGTRLAVTSLDLNFIVAANGISILQVRGDSVVPEWREDSQEWGPKDPVWVGEDTVRFTRVWAREQRRSMPESPAMAVRGPGGWTIQGVVPDTLPEDTTEVQ